MPAGEYPQRGVVARLGNVRELTCFGCKAKPAAVVGKLCIESGDGATYRQTCSGWVANSYFTLPEQIPGCDN